MAKGQSTIRVQRWQGGQHPTIANIMGLMRREGLRPYTWMNKANHRHAVRTHGYDKVLYVLDGSIEVILPDSNQRLRLRTGDRMDVPAGVRYGTITGSGGARCIEAAAGRGRVATV